MILDILRLVDDLKAEAFSLVGIDIPLQKVIGSDKDVIFVVFLNDSAPFFFRTCHQASFQLRSKSAQFLSPVVDQ